MEFTLLAAAATGLAFLGLGLTRDGLRAELDRLVTAAALGLLAGRLTAMVATGVNPLAHPGDVLFVRGGVSPVGATAAVLAYLAWAYRRQRLLLGRLAPAAMLGVAGWHTGCLWRGTCLGSAADVAWGWSVAGSEVTRHPVELYTAALIVLAALALRRANLGSGTVGLALAAVAAARLLTEPLRLGVTEPPLAWYGAGVGAGLAVYLVSRAAETRLPLEEGAP